MKQGRQPRFLWFKLSLVVGALLGVLLLVQSIASYYYVSRRLVRDEVRREAERYAVSLEREAREGNLRDNEELRGLLGDVRKEAPARIAWIRVLDWSGQMQADSGGAAGPPTSLEKLRRAVENHDNGIEIRETPAGRVLVSAFPLRMAPPRLPGREPPPRPSSPRRRSGPWLMEIAIYLEGTSAAFHALRTNLAVSLSAAIALLVSMAVLALRFRKYVQGKQLEQQLDLARSVQRRLLPPAEPFSGAVDFAAECVPAWQVGGDLYDAFRTGDNRVALVLGDISGKGLPAALLMSLLHGAVRASRWTGSREEHESATRVLNDLLCTVTSHERFASMFWCHYDPREQALRYVNAGHLPPLVVGRNAAGELDVRRLDEGGPVLGVVPGIDYRQGEIAVRPGDLLVIYSDGIVEAMNAAEDEFGEERLWEVIRASWQRPAGEIRDAILRGVVEFLAGELPQDDQTLVVVRLEGETRDGSTREHAQRAEPELEQVTGG